MTTETTTPMLKVGDKVTVVTADWRWGWDVPTLRFGEVKSTRRFTRWTNIMLTDKTEFRQMRDDGRLPNSEGRHNNGMKVRIYRPAHEAEKAANEARRKALSRVADLLGLDREYRTKLFALTNEELTALADKIEAGVAADKPKAG